MTERRPPYLAAALTAAGLLALYALTLAPTTAFWDTSEYITTAYILGIPHPPGNPLFVALARTWIVLLEPTGLSVAVRVNLLAATTSAAAGGFMTLVAWRAIVGFARSPRVAVAGAVAAGWLGGTAFTVWNQSNANEKVYTVSVLVVAAVSWLALRWRDAHRAGEEGSERWLLAAAYLAVLGSTNHLMSVLPVPALGLFVLAVAPAVLIRRSFLVRAIPLVLLGLSFNFFLPIRAAEDPVINEGEPTCESASGAALAIYTQGRLGCPALAASLTREQYRKPPVTERQAPFAAQMLNWWQYFDWQWARGLVADERPGTARTGFSLLFLGLGLAGLWAVLRSDGELALYFGALAVTLTVGLVFYLNFRYGYSLAPEVTDRLLHEVRERDYFFIAGFMFWGTLAGIGLTWAWTVAASVAGPAVGHRWTAPVLAVAVIPLALNFMWADRSAEWAARDWAYDLLMSVEPYGVIFTNGDNDTFPLWYVQEVEGIRRDVTVIVGQYLHTTWYLKQLQRLTTRDRQRAFAYPEGVEPYFDSIPAPPSSPVTSLESNVMDQVGSGRLAEPNTVSFPELAVTFPAGMFLDRSHRLAIRTILDSAGERPIFFAARAGMMSELGLGRWGVRHGLATKLELRGSDEPARNGVVTGSESYGGEAFDVERSRHLYERVYTYRGFLDRDVWADRSTLGIAWQYYIMALQLADIAVLTDRPEDEVARLMGHADAFLVTARGGRLGTPARLLEDGS